MEIVLVVLLLICTVLLSAVSYTMGQNVATRRTTQLHIGYLQEAQKSLRIERNLRERQKVYRNC